MKLKVKKNSFSKNGLLVYWIYFFARKQTFKQFFFLILTKNKK